MIIIDGHKLTTKYERSAVGMPPCPHCNARENLPCFTPAGAPSKPHAKRYAVSWGEHVDKTTPPPESPMVLDQILRAGAFRIGNSDMNHEPRHYTAWSVAAWCGANGNALPGKGKRVAHPSMGMVNCPRCLDS